MLHRHKACVVVACSSHVVSFNSITMHNVCTMSARIQVECEQLLLYPTEQSMGQRMLFFRTSKSHPQRSLSKVSRRQRGVLRGPIVAHKGGGMVGHFSDA